MLPELTDEQKMLKEMIASFTKNEVAPLAYEIDRDERFPKEAFRRLAELQVLGITAPAEYGGAGAGYMEMCIVTEELAVHCGSTAATYADHADLCIDNIRRNGRPNQLSKYLPPLCDGNLIGGLRRHVHEAPG
jgi:isovaleryl-CoA dehydrogenase